MNSNSCLNKIKKIEEKNLMMLKYVRFLACVQKRKLNQVMSREKREKFAEMS